MKAEKIVDKLLADLTDREGFRQKWDETDRDTQREIRKAWITIVGKGIYAQVWLLLPLPCRFADRTVKSVSKGVVTLDDGSRWKQGTGTRINDSPSDGRMTIRPKTASDLAAEDRAAALERIRKVKWEKIPPEKLAKVIEALDKEQK